ncbi:hypothetical protein AB0E62_00205 [Streptomyces sp. NPDC038707]|uniref:hypothetical protein n=1 Tax=Streptomyces sp. NPDC038707 TaxID=3154329 RepID=UPI0033C06DF4
MKKTILGGLVAALLLFGSVGCSQYNDERGKGDAPVANRSGEDSPKAVTNNPDGFGNVATGCVAGAPGFRYFVTTNTGGHPSSLVVQQDESCR